MPADKDTANELHPQPAKAEPYERSLRQSRDIAQAIEDWCHTVQAGEQT